MGQAARSQRERRLAFLRIWPVPIHILRKNAHSLTIATINVILVMAVNLKSS